MYYNEFENTKRDIRKNIGRVLKYCRTHASKSQQEMAEILHISKSNVCRYESGVTEIPASIIPIVGYSCHITMKEMLRRFDTEEMTNKLNYLEEPEKEEFKKDFMKLPEKKQNLIMASETILEIIGKDNVDFSSQLIDVLITEVNKEKIADSQRNRILLYYKKIQEMYKK